MTDTVAHLVRAVVANPHEHTNLLALADALDEAHPQGRDGRAMLLRSLINNPGRPRFYRSEHGSTGPIHDDGLGTTASIHTSIVNPEFRQPLNYQVMMTDWAPRNHFGPIRDWGFHIPVSTSEAREIADHLPNSDDFHHFLDQEFGPRASPPDPYADHYIRAINTK